MPTFAPFELLMIALLLSGIPAGIYLALRLSRRAPRVESEGG